MDLSIEEIREIIANNEKKYLQERRFKLNRDTSEIELSSLNAFLDWFLNNDNGNRGTICIWEDQEIKPRNAFDPKIAPEIQCRRAKNRSTHDIFLLSKYYFPEITLEEVICELVNLNENLKIYSLQCPHISARVWYKNNRLDFSESFYRTSVTSHYDIIGGKDDDGNLRKIVELTDGLNYLHLKKLYEYINQQEEIAA